MLQLQTCLPQMTTTPTPLRSLYAATHVLPVGDDGQSPRHAAAAASVHAWCSYTLPGRVVMPRFPSLIANPHGPCPFNYFIPLNLSQILKTSKQQLQFPT